MTSCPVCAVDSPPTRRLWGPTLGFAGLGLAAVCCGISALSSLVGGGASLASYGVLALLLAAVGLYGVIAYSVSRRTREIGVRKALGAEHAQILGLILKRGMLLVAIGGVAGAVLAGLGGRLLGSVLFVRALDPVSFGLSFLVLASVAALANWMPAWRASRVDPMRVLKGE